MSENILGFRDWLNPDFAVFADWRLEDISKYSKMVTAHALNDMETLAVMLDGDYLYNSPSQDVHTETITRNSVVLVTTTSTKNAENDWSINIKIPMHSIDDTYAVKKDVANGNWSQKKVIA